MNLSPSQRQFIRQHENENVRDLALRFSRDDLPLLLAQIKGRQTAKHKIPSWYENNAVIYPATLSMEQSSSELTARYKASLLPRGKERFADISGGLGVDFYFLSQQFEQAVYVEQNQELCEIVQHNFSALGLKNTAIENAQCEDFLRKTTKLDVIFADPARRDDIGRKVFKIEDCTPDIAQLKSVLLEKSDWVMIKYSPMLDISLAVNTFGCVREVHIVSVNNECKELLFLLTKENCDCIYHTINIKKSGAIESFSFSPESERQIEPEYTSQLGIYLYEPNASILKAGGFNSVSKSFQLIKLHKHSHLYTSDALIPDFPGRTFTVQNWFLPNKQNIRKFALSTKKSNVSVRNFPVTVNEIRKKTGIREGGDVFLFATTLCNNEKIWVMCEKTVIL